MVTTRLEIFPDLKKNSANEHLYSLLIISRFFGLLPRNADFEISKIWTVHGIVLRCFIACVTPYFIYKAISFWETGYYIKMKIGFAICAEILSAISPALHFTVILKNGYFWRTLWNVYKELMVENIHTATSTILFAGIISGAVLEVIDMLHYPTPKGTVNLIHMICSWISDSSIIIIIVQFCVILNTLKAQVVLVNDKLMMNNLFQTSFLLEQAMDSHIKYLKLAKKTNQIFSLQLLTSCVALFNKFLSYLYDIMVDLLMKGLDIQVTIYRFSAAIHCLLFVYFLVKTCQDFRNEVDNLNFNIFETSRKMQFSRNIIEIHTYVLMKNQIQFTAAGFFNLDYSIITSMTAMAVTFLVVILQFSLSTSFKMAPNINLGPFRI